MKNDSNDPTHTHPLITVVIETVNDESEPVLELDQVLEGLANQTYPQDRLHIIVSMDRTNHDLQKRLEEQRPDIEQVILDDPTYYSMKAAGIEKAGGDIVALLDSDCLPVPGWAEAIEQSIANGADAVAGKTRYVIGSPWSKTFNFFNFGYITGDKQGIASAFLPNNAAFRREVIQQHSFDPNIRRGGGGHFLSKQLKALGYRLVYCPEMRAFHNAYGFNTELNMRIKVGFDSVNLAGLDEAGVMKETSVIRSHGVLGLLSIWAKRMVYDARLAIRNRQDLDIALYQVPYFVLLSPVVRTVELVSALVTMAKPDYFKEKYGW